MRKVKAIAKNKMHWGILLYAAIQIARLQRYITEEVAMVLDTTAMGLGIYGARTTNRKDS